MKFLHLLLLTTFCATLVPAYATTYYRHIPLSLTLKPGDKLIVNYDYSGESGIRCIANKEAEINFVFRGHPKSAYLPITLQNAHIPKNNREALADIEGQFSISHDEAVDLDQRILVTCTYKG